MGKVFKRNISVYCEKVVKSGKNNMKTTDFGKRFKEERYLSAVGVFGANTEIIFL